MRSRAWGFRTRLASSRRPAISDGGVTIQLTLDTLEAPDFVEVRVRVDEGSITFVEGRRK